MNNTNPLVTIAVPSYNQGQFLNKTLHSIFEQNVSVEVFVMDNASTDNSVEIIKQWAPYLAGWRSHPDQGQSAAINEGISQGSAPYVLWLNSDDWLLPNGLEKLLAAIERYPESPVVYGRAWNYVQSTGTFYPVWTETFCEHRLAKRCIISQPATLIRRSAWQAVNGLNTALDLAMDYDLWWRLFKNNGSLRFIDELIAINRIHGGTKTKNNRFKHYQEAIQTVKQYYGRVPLKWWLYQPYSVWFKSRMK